MPSWMDDERAARRQRGLLRRRRRLASAQGPRIILGGRELVNFSSNDYLNLAADPRLAAAAAKAARRFGCGAGASPLVSGWLPPLRALERDLAAFARTEAALVFASGYAANLACVASLAGEGDVVFSDALNHASLIDGCRLSRARVHVYRHCDIAHLEDLLKSEGRSARRRLIVTDGVFSMDGDIAPVTELLDLARRYDALLLVDEAHATGVIGATGRGVCEGLADAADGLVKVGTLSKALGSQGGFVCGSRRLIDHLVNAARPYLFSTALAPPAAAAARRALRIIDEEPERRCHLFALVRRLGAHRPSPTPIVPVVVGDAAKAVSLSKRLEKEGFLVPAIRPPTVPEGTSRLRVSVAAGHTTEDVARLANALLDAP